MQSSIDSVDVWQPEEVWPGGTKNAIEIIGNWKRLSAEDFGGAALEDRIKLFESMEEVRSKRRNS